LNPHVAIIGGGITGLTAAYTLLKEGARVTVLEGRQAIGGLSATHDFGDFRWDRFYHCILKSDTSLLQLLKEIGLHDKLRWRNTEVGFYSRDALYTMTGPIDLLRFPCLSFPAKVRFGLGILYAAQLRRGDRLESIPLRDWTVRVFGETVYRELWEPLLRCKLGEMRSQTSAAFLWATIRRLYSTRDKSTAKREQLGYVEGGYRSVFDRLLEAILGMNGKIETGVRLSRVEPIQDGITVFADATERHFDACLMTVPAPAILACTPTLSEEYRARLETPIYLGMVCVALVMRQPLSPYYLTNVTQEAPFTGIVEMTNLIDADAETDGHTLVYLPKYTSPSDPLFHLSDTEVWERFAAALFRIHPQLRRTDIQSVQVFRERYVQPVPTLNYSAHKPGIVTGIPSLFVANTSQIVNDTLNNNAMVGIARAACEVILEDRRRLGSRRDEGALNMPKVDATLNVR
jgi:protoporphyrinogen oxidase